MKPLNTSPITSEEKREYNKKLKAARKANEEYITMEEWLGVKREFERNENMKDIAEWIKKNNL